MADVFAFAEARSGELRKVALETVTAARGAADALGGQVHVLLAGAPGIAAKAAELGRYGADTVLVCEHEAFARYNPEAMALLCAERVKGGSYRLALFPSSALGGDLVPRVAAKLGVGAVSDVTSVSVDGDAIVVRHPMNIGKVTATVRMTATPAVAGVRPNTFTPAERPKAGAVETIAPAGDPSAVRVKVTEVVLGTGTKLDLGEAPVVVAGGRGLKGAEHFTLIEELAAAFGNAAVGATRAVTDEGWRPQSDQIGQTGRTVSPQLYVAVGISGAIQHLAGMRTAKTIVAVNKDKEAPIFKVADYGIVGDVFEVIPALTQAVREAKARG